MKKIGIGLMSAGITMIMIALIQKSKEQTSDYQMNVTKSGIIIMDGERVVEFFPTPSIPKLDSTITKDNQ